MSCQLTKNQQIIGLLSTFLIAAIPMLPSPAVAQQACVMTKAGKKVCGTLILMGAPTNPVAPADRSKKTTSSKSSGSAAILDYSNDVKISVQLEKCAEYGSDVLCKFSLTKIQGDNDNEGAVFAHFKSGQDEVMSEAIDDKDRSYTATQVRARLVDRSDKGIVLPFAKNRLIPVTLVFKIPDDVKVIKKLTLPVLYGKNDPKVATFSNINVGR